MTESPITHLYVSANYFSAETYDISGGFGSSGQSRSLPSYKRMGGGFGGKETRSVVYWPLPPLWHPSDFKDLSVVCWAVEIYAWRVPCMWHSVYVEYVIHSWLATKSDSMRLAS